MTKIAGVLLKLPSSKIVLNRRGKTAPTSPGKLALYGGHIEKDETPFKAAVRELSEETSLTFNKNDLKFVGEFDVTQEGKAKKFFIYTLNIDREDFDVYEGDGSEVYEITDVLNRNDLTESLRKTLDLESISNES